MNQKLNGFRFKLWMILCGILTTNAAGIKAAEQLIFPIPQEMQVTNDVFTLDGTRVNYYPGKCHRKRIFRLPVHWWES